MAKIITTIAAEDGMNFDEILSFKTENYIGLYNAYENEYMLLEKSSFEFSPCIVTNCDNLRELDDKVFNICDEHITEVFDENRYTIELG